jgi:hypothetical protein
MVSYTRRIKKCVLVGYFDIDFVGSVDDRESTLGYLMNMGSMTISWSCKKQTIVANSFAEA